MLIRHIMITLLYSTGSCTVGKEVSLSLLTTTSCRGNVMRGRNGEGAASGSILRPFN